MNDEMALEKQCSALFNNSVFAATLVKAMLPIKKKCMDIARKQNTDCRSIA
jgi:hypothetical protein